MKKLLLTALISVASVSAIAGHSVSLDGVRYDAKVAGTTFNFEGVGVGYEYSGNLPVNVGAHLIVADTVGIDLTSVSVYAAKELFSKDKFYAGASVGLGYTEIDAGAGAKSDYISLPVGLEAGANVLDNVAVYGGVGYRFDWATDSKDLDVDGWNYKLGVKYKF